MTEGWEAEEDDFGPDEQASDEANEQSEPQLYFPDLDAFVREFLRIAYRRQINGRTRVWAARWWEYPEALIRLEALWRAWEHLRLDGATGMSVWYRDHADHHMAILMDPDGPFASVDSDSPENLNRRGEALPYESPPAGLFAEGGSNDRA